MVQIAPELLEAVRRRQGVGVVTQVVLAELAGGVAEIEQELGERRRPGLQVGRAAGELWRDHTRAQRIHAGEEGIAPGRAALHGVVVRERCALTRDAVDVGCLSDRQPAVVGSHLHPADIVTHDEQDVWFLALLGGCLGARRRRTSKQCEQRKAEVSHSNHMTTPYKMLTNSIS